MKQNLSTIYLKNLGRCLEKEPSSDDEKLKAFYHLAKFIVSDMGTKEFDENKKLNLTMMDSLLLEGVSVDRFVQFFPIKKTYNGKNKDWKDYFSVINSLKENGPVIKEPFEFLWDYDNLLTSFYLVEKMSLISHTHEEETGKSIIEECFGIKPKRLLNINGKEVIFDPDTGKTAPVKPSKRKPEWIRAVKL